MKKSKENFISIVLMGLLASACLPTAAFANVDSNMKDQATLVYSAEEITDKAMLQYRINNHINDINVEGITIEATERIVDNGNVKMIDSAPTIQKIKAIRTANGSLEETYVAISLGEMQVRSSTSTASGSLFVSSVDYVTKLYFTRSYVSGISGNPCYQPLGGEIVITATRDNFTVTRIDIVTGGEGYAHNVNGNFIGVKNYVKFDSKTGNNVASLYASPNCPYYFEALSSSIGGVASGIGTRGTISAKHGTSTYSGDVEVVRFDSIGLL